MESKEKILADMAVAKWFEDNHAKGLHLEQWDESKLYPLMASHMRKLSSDENFEPPEHVRPETLDKIFRTILKSGLLVAENPKAIGEQEKRKAEAAALDAEIVKEIDLELFVMRLENQGGWRAVSEWLHTKATKDQKQLFDRLYPSGATVPDATPQQKNLFIVRALRPTDYRIVYVANDSTFSTARSREDAVPLGKTRSENAADFLRKSGQYLNVIIEPIG